MHFTVRIEVSLMLVIALTLSRSWDGGDRLHVLVKDLAALGGSGGHGLCDYQSLTRDVDCAQE